MPGPRSRRHGDRAMRLHERESKEEARRSEERSTDMISGVSKVVIERRAPTTTRETIGAATQGQTRCDVVRDDRGDAGSDGWPPASLWWRCS